MKSQLILLGLGLSGLSLLLSACNDGSSDGLADGTAGSTGTAGSDGTAGSTGGGGTGSEEAGSGSRTPTGEGVRYLGESADASDYLFDDDALRTYELVLAPEDWAFLDADPAAEVYVEGALRFEGMEVGPVGIRYKGSIGAFAGCVAEGNFLNPAGAKTCDKLSMKVKINWNSDDLFYGLKKLQFHAMNNDRSMMRERLAYKVFREMNVPAPRAVHARLVINGEYQGIFALVEQIDSRFTRSRFRDGKGNLYKEIWPLTSAGHARSQDEFEESMKSNRTRLSEGRATVDRMLRFAGAAAGTSEADMLGLLGEWLDLDHMMRYVATDRGLLNDDGVYHWYCSGFGDNCSPHNFFWYEEEEADRLYLVPWDMDISMVLMSPITTLHTQWDETTNGCNPYFMGSFPLKDAACDPILGGLTQLQSEFAEHTAALLDGPFAEDVVHEDLDRWRDQIRDAVAEAATQRPDAPSLAGMLAGIQALKVDLAEMRRRMRARIGRP